MGRLNRSVIPSGMLNPSGLGDTIVDPNVQATARPAGSLLRPSPGFDSVRVGRNRFQGKGPSGGFRRQEFAEEIGGGGAVLSVVPGETTQVEASEWLPDAREVAEGSIIIADREHHPGTAMAPHEGYNTFPDMGDRTPGRPLSREWFSRLNPSSVLRAEYQTSPALSVAMGAGLVYVVYLIATEVERQVGRSHPRGVASTAASVPAGAAEATGDSAKDVSDKASEAVTKIGEATDQAVSKISAAADDAVGKISNTAKE